MSELREPADRSNKTTEIRASFARSAGLIIFVTLGAFIAVVLTSAHTSVRYSSEVAVRSAEEQTRAELVRFFSPVETQLGLLADWSKDGVLSIDSPESLNRLLIPILRSQSAATSLLIATDDGREYMLLKTSDGWLNRRIDRRTEARASHWTRLSPSGQALETYDRDLEYDSKTRPWFIGAKDKPNQVVWTEPYTFFTTKDPGVTAAVRVNTPSGQVTIALDLMLQDISTYTTSLQASTSGAVAVATSSGTVLGLPRDPRFETPEQRKNATLKPLADLDRPVLEAALEAHQKNPGDIRRVIINQVPWWITAKDAGLPHLALVVMVAIPESTFQKPMKTQQMLMFLIVSLALVAGGFLMWRTNRQLSRLVEQAGERRFLGEFSLHELIVSTANYDVYRADHDSIQRPMVIKIFKGRVPENIAQRLNKLQELTDPHAGVPVEFGVTADGTYFQADFDYGGVTLSELLTSGPLALNRSIIIARQICVALQDAHSNDVIHGNLRPSNIIVERRGADDTFVRVIDFAVAPGQMDAAENAGYVAPESIENPGTLSMDCDVYALGAILYEMVNHQPAYTGQTSTAVLMKQLTEAPTAIGDHVPEFIRDLVSACLERRPAKRASLDEVLTALKTPYFSVSMASVVTTPRPPTIANQKRTPA